jgi:outer membrane lipopolysaccharide assembly protein LptE/RlpB
LITSVVLLLAALLSSSCGYTLAGRGSFLPDSIKTVGIPTFVNRTPYGELEQVLTQRVRSEFIGRGKYKVLPQDTGVDAVLRVTINSATPSPTGFNESQQATRYAITIVVSIQFVDARDNKVLWQNQSQVFREEYQLATATAGAGGVLDAATFFGQASNAIDRMAQDFAKAVVSAVLEAF